MNKYKIDRITIILIVYSIVLWVYVYSSLSQTALVSGDSGQWILLARFYRGEAVPNYLRPAAYPPVYPVFLATAITLTGNPVEAVSLLGATIFVLLGISFFILGKELWDSSAGFLALLIGTLSQYLFLYATSWGAYPELLFLAWLNLAASRFIKVHRNGYALSRQHVYLGLFLALALFTHFPSAIVLVAVFGIPSFCYLISTKSQPIKNKTGLLLAFLDPLIVWSVYVSFVMNETIGYIQNEAALFSRGINTVWSYLLRTPDSSAFVVASVLATAVGVAYVSRKKAGSRSFGFGFVSSWLFSTVILMCALYLFGIQTEYTRFAYLILPPLVLNLAGALSAFLNINMHLSLHIENLKPRSLSMKKLLWPLVLIILLLPFPAIHRLYTKSINYYSVWKPDDFQEALQWIESNIPVNESVLTSKKIEGRLLEGLTGRSALFSFPERASYRPWEHDRSIATDTLLESSIAVENGYVLVKFEKDYQSVPIQPSVAVCREGEYEDALWLRDSLTRITLVSPTNKVQTFSIRSIDRFSHDVVREPEAIRIISRFEEGINQTVLYLNRTITIAKESPVVSIQYAMRTTSSFRAQNFSIGVLDPWGQTRKDTQFDERELRLVYETSAQREMTVRLAWSIQDAVVSAQPISNKDSRIVTWLTFFPNATQSAKLSIKIITTPTGRLVNDLRFFESSELVEQYDVQAAIVSKDGNTWYKKINLHNIGFDIAFENDSYIVMVRSTGV